MIFDATNLFSDAQAITASAASTNVIDFGATGTPKHAANALSRDLGKGRKLDFTARVVEDFATLTSLTLVIQGSVDAAFSSPVTIATSAAIPAASLVAGYVFPLPVIPRGASYRYMRTYYTVGGSNATAGKITAGLVFADEERDV